MKALAGSLRILTIMAVMLLALGFSACGDDGAGNNGGSQSPIPSPEANVESVDACEVVDQEDATKLFGKPAAKDEGVMVVDPLMGGECLWSWESEEFDSQLLQFRIWNGEQYYTETAQSPEAQDFDIGDRGHITVSDYASIGVDIEWVQDGKTISVSYSTVGNGVPDPSEKVEELKQLAQKASDEL